MFLLGTLRYHVVKVFLISPCRLWNDRWLGIFPTDQVDPLHQTLDQYSLSLLLIRKCLFNFPFLNGEDDFMHTLSECGYINVSYQPWKRFIWLPNEAPQRSMTGRLTMSGNAAKLQDCFVDFIQYQIYLQTIHCIIEHFILRYKK